MGGRLPSLLAAQARQARCASLADAHILQTSCIRVGLPYMTALFHVGGRAHLEGVRPSSQLHSSCRVIVQWMNPCRVTQCESQAGISESGPGRFSRTGFPAIGTEARAADVHCRFRLAQSTRWYEWTRTVHV